MNVRPTPLEVATPVDLAREAAFRLGETEVRPSTLELVRDSHAVTIEPKVMQALVAMARHLGQVTSRDELVETCWSGRFVSEDAIQRTIAKLRQAAEQHGGGDFVVETIPRVGYRLALMGPTSVMEAVAPPVAGAGITRGRLWMGLAGVGLIAAVVAGAVTWTSLRAAAPVASVSLSDFRGLGPGVPADLPAMFGETVRDAFGEDNDVVIRTRGADYALHGVIQRVGDKLRYSVRLEDTRDGTMVWAASPELPVDASPGPRRMAVVVSQVVRCGLKGAATHPRPLPSHTLALYLQYCDAYVGLNPSDERGLALARRAVAETPDFSWGWSAVANSAASLYFKSSGGEKARYASEVRSATAQALRLDPRNGQAYEVQTYILPPSAFAEREALLRRAVRSHLTACGCELVNMGHFLSSVGRIREANSYFRQAYDSQPLSFAAGISLAVNYDKLGQWERAEEVFRRVGATYGEWPGPWRAIHASYRGDWSVAKRAAETAPASVRPALQSAIEALASGDAARIAAARPALEQMTRSAQHEAPPLRTGMADTLIAVGSRDEAFHQLQILVDSGTSNVLFTPRAKTLRHDPRFERLLQQGGLMAYWRQSGTRPDLCQQPDPPGFCRTLPATPG